MRPPTGPDTFKEWLRSAEFSAFIRMRMRAAHIPGLSIAVIDRGDLIHTAGFGLADISAGRSTRALTLLALRHSIIELRDACV
jgi:CubicO group peptidase (beta-lactamase class C family)